MYGGIKYWKEQHTFNPLAQHNQQNIQGRTYTGHCIGTYLRHTIGTTTGGITSMLLQHHQHLHHIGTCKPFAQDTIGTAPLAQHTIGTTYHWHNILSAQHHRHNIPSAQHTIGTTYYRHNILSAQHTISTIYYWHYILLALHTIGTTYYWHITLVTQHTIGTMYMILSQSFAGKCKIYLCSNSSMLPETTLRANTQKVTTQRTLRRNRITSVLERKPKESSNGEPLGAGLQQYIYYTTRVLCKAIHKAVCCTRQ